MLLDCYPASIMRKDGCSWGGSAEYALPRIACPIQLAVVGIDFGECCTCLRCWLCWESGDGSIEPAMIAGHGLNAEQSIFPQYDPAIHVLTILPFVIAATICLSNPAKRWLRVSTVLPLFVRMSAQPTRSLIPSSTAGFPVGGLWDHTGMVPGQAYLGQRRVGLVLPWDCWSRWVGQCGWKIRKFAVPTVYVNTRTDCCTLTVAASIFSGSSESLSHFSIWRWSKNPVLKWLRWGGKRFGRVAVVGTRWFAQIFNFILSASSITLRF